MLKLRTILIEQLDFDNLSKLILASRGQVSGMVFRYTYKAVAISCKL